MPPRVVKANPAACQRIDRCAINCLAGKVEFLDTIRDICTAEEIILIRTEDRDFRNSCLIAPFVKGNREENNVNAYVDNKLVGIIRVVGDGASVVFVQDLLVYPQYHRQGIGTALLKKIMEEYDGVYQLHLLTENTEKTIAFYKSLGFLMDTDIECRAFSKYCVG